MKNRIFAVILTTLLPASFACAAIAEPDSLLRFLYNSMPLPDRVDYTKDFYRTNIESSLRARLEMPWGDSVPEREFMHFVLPVRVNNEALDLSRPLFFAELKDRVRNLSMKDAILEVNHWCHEKVTYQPSDPRTSSPLSTVSQAIGRCGEESTFTVAALRSIGIPARQVYTPRWAHTDDNHAWVEAWADGKWWFLGACEPEPMLNLAWFNTPASRGMLMHTSVYGEYDGPEERLSSDKYSTVINITRHYAPVAPINVRAMRTDGNPAEGVTIDFRLYNYADFYPLASKRSDAAGHASITAGKGDILVWASDGHNFGYAIANSQDTAVIVLDKNISSYRGSDHFTLTPPPASGVIPSPTGLQTDLNNRRLAIEDSIRRSYTATFISAEDSRKTASRLGLDFETISRLLPAARGNHDTITRFLESATDREKALRLLLTLSEKDLRDVTPEVLADHIATPDQNTVFFDEYIMSPRVEWENLTPYKSFFSNVFSKEDMDAFCADPASWTECFKRHTTIDNSENPKMLRMSPKGVWTAGKADEESAKIAFVAGARACGIPARINPVTGKAQYADTHGKWIDVNLSGSTTTETVDTGSLKAGSIEYGAVPDPKYYSHFSLCSLESGRPRQLEYPDEMTLDNFLNETSELKTGEYMLVTAQRLADGSVMVNLEFFPVKKDQSAVIPVSFPKSETEIQVIGNLDSEHFYYDLLSKSNKSLLSSTGRGYYILGIIRPNHEPSEHALNDISAIRKQFEIRNEKIMLLCRDKEELKRLDSTCFPRLPNNVIIGADIDGGIYGELQKSLKLKDEELPVFIIADTFNRVIYAKSGYTIGTGADLMSILRRL